ncbi:hypothetical protein NECAME_03082 [Necator americanus]|uniref:Uncharacterized protein n=1 Tax=Necator americanus TaxID=51031 RepID=W2T7R5_NECAM|nr:hypothetical protein NECAME_03082 [Necator americanus]ETN77664.1 hypothetical protein NECAME_03082 [Necator americanus]
MLPTTTDEDYYAFVDDIGKSWRPAKLQQSSSLIIWLGVAEERKEHYFWRRGPCDTLEKYTYRLLRRDEIYIQL